METREIRAPCFPPGLFFMRLYGYVPKFRIFSANAVLQVIVDKPRSLQVGVTNRSPEEFESSFFHVLAHGGEDAGISLNDRKVLTIGFLSGKNDRVYS